MWVAPLNRMGSWTGPKWEKEQSTSFHLPQASIAMFSPNMMDSSCEPKETFPSFGLFCQVFLSRSLNTEAREYQAGLRVTLEDEGSVRWGNWKGVRIWNHRITYKTSQQPCAASSSLTRLQYTGMPSHRSVLCGIGKEHIPCSPVLSFKRTDHI